MGESAYLSVLVIDDEVLSLIVYEGVCEGIEALGLIHYRPRRAHLRDDINI